MEDVRHPAGQIGKVPVRPRGALQLVHRPVVDHGHRRATHRPRATDGERPIVGASLGAIGIGGLNGDEGRVVRDGDVKNLPLLLAGGGFRHGKHLHFDPHSPPPLCNLYVSMLQRLGIEVDKFSSSTGTLSGLEPLG